MIGEEVRKEEVVHPLTLGDYCIGRDSVRAEETDKGLKFGKWGVSSDGAELSKISFYLVVQLTGNR